MAAYLRQSAEFDGRSSGRSMSVTVSVMSTVVVAGGEPIARVESDTGTIHLWPGGVGVGPVIHIDAHDWPRIVNGVHAAQMAAREEKEQSWQ